MKRSAALIEAVLHNRLEDAQALLRDEPSLARATNPQGVSVLTLAAYTRNQTAIDLLLQYRDQLDLFEALALGRLDLVKEQLTSTDIDRFSPDGFTPLGLATFFGHEALVRWLLEQGADPNLPSQNDFRVSPHHSAAAISHVPLARLLLAHGAEVNAKQASGVTALHSAAHNGQLELAQLLVEAGADLHARMDNGLTPLSMALQDGQGTVAAYLRERGASA